MYKAEADKLDLSAYPDYRVPYWEWQALYHRLAGPAAEKLLPKGPMYKACESFIRGRRNGLLKLKNKEAKTPPAGDRAQVDERAKPTVAVAAHRDRRARATDRDFKMIDTWAPQVEMKLSKSNAPKPVFDEERLQVVGGQADKGPCRDYCHDEAMSI